MSQPTSLGCATVSGGGVREGTMRLVQLSTGFQSLPPLPTSKLGPSGADSQVGGFVYILGPCRSLQQKFSCEAGSFSCFHHNPHRYFQSEVLRLYVPMLEPWVAQSVSLHSSSPGLSACKCGTTLSTSCHLASSPFCPAAHLHPSYWYG